MVTKKLYKQINAANDKLAESISKCLKQKGIICINIMGAPGSGKTTLIEGISHFINPKEIAVIQGDLESDVDKKRLEKKKIACYQINTHSGCHLNAAMIKHEIVSMKSQLSGKKFLFIENVGNLVCPAGKKIGQHLNIVVSSVAEGSDKPKKYPIIFHDAALVVLSKYDLKHAVGFDEKAYLRDLRNINGRLKIIKL